MVLYSLGKHNACKCTVSVEGAHLVPGLGFDPAHSGRRSAPSPLHQPCTTLAPQCHKELYAGLDFQEKTSGQLAPKFSDLVASKSVSISEKQGLLVTSEKKKWLHWQPQRLQRRALVCTQSMHTHVLENNYATNLDGGIANQNSLRF